MALQHTPWVCISPIPPWPPKHSPEQAACMSGRHGIMDEGAAVPNGGLDPF